MRELHDELGLDMVNLTMGNPYATTHVTRPFDFGKYEPDEHPFVGLSRMIHGIGEVKKAVPAMTVWHPLPVICAPMQTCSLPVQLNRDCVMVCCLVAWHLPIRILQMKSSKKAASTPTVFA